ncbi:MAG: hypothetical protein HQK93_10520, partial [Nitrospirae bacterium]|nr:hypothetical protein [Nitrospirota bacterium]
MLGKIGKYTAATLEYGMLKTGSIMQKGVNIVSGTVTGTAFRTNKRSDLDDNDHDQQGRHRLKDTLNIVPRLTVEAGRYTYAVIEYAGQMVYVLLKKGGQAIAAPVVVAMRSKGNLVTSFDNKTFINFDKNIFANLGQS